MVSGQLTVTEVDTRPSTEPRTFSPLSSWPLLQCQASVSPGGPQQLSESLPGLFPLPKKQPSRMLGHCFLTLLVSAYSSQMGLACSGTSSGLSLCLGCPPFQVSSPSLLCSFPCLGGRCTGNLPGQEGWFLSHVCPLSHGVGPAQGRLSCSWEPESCHTPSPKEKT